jgi:hypothetical protein
VFISLIFCILPSQNNARGGNVLLFVEFFAERLKGGSRENGFDGQAKEFANPKSEFEARIILVTFQIAQRLVIDV